MVHEIFTISFNLFKLMIPIIIIVKVIEELGGIKYIGQALEPVMQLVGLPASMGLVWATTMISNIYAGMIIFINTQETLSVAQVTVLGGMMLFAHSLPIEIRIMQKAGVRVLYTLLLRLGGALLLGIILHQIYSSEDWLNQTNTPVWNPDINPDTNLTAWVLTQIKMLFQIFLIISGLIIFLRLLKLSGIEKLIAWILQPLLKLLGMSNKTSLIAIIGMTLGLTYGGGLLINEAQSDRVSKTDIFGSITLLAICHSIIEDTILIMLLGADITGALYFRVLFALLLTAILIRLARNLSVKHFDRYFVYPGK